MLFPQKASLNQTAYSTLGGWLASPLLQSKVSASLPASQDQKVSSIAITTCPNKAGGMVRLEKEEEGSAHPSHLQRLSC